MQLLDRIRQTIRRHDLARTGTRVLVALSGGSDSVALAHLLTALDSAGELTVAGFAHLNHQLRVQADSDQQFCAELARVLDRPFVTDHCDIRAVAEANHQSIEDAGHCARYEFFERTRLSLPADVVALGHTRDDQAETFLLRLLRGAGARGLAAMHPHRDAIIRPLIDCRRAELRQYLDGRTLPFVTDQSNDDATIPRNRIRAELLPLLEERFNPSIVDVLAADADIAREEWRWMDEAAAELTARVVRRDGSTRSRIDADAINSAPVALARLVIQRALRNAAGGRTLSLTHIDEVLRLCREHGGPVDLPGQRAERVDKDVVLTTRTDERNRRGESSENLFKFPLSIPGEVRLGQAGYLVTAEHAAAAPAEPRKDVAAIQLNGSAGPLAVRNRRPGDKFRPIGLGGAKKLQDVFVDRKVARDTRDRVPIVVDENDRIIWVAGYGIDERFQVREPTQAVVILRLKLLGESE